MNDNLAGRRLQGKVEGQAPSSTNNTPSSKRKACASHACTSAAAAAAALPTHALLHACSAPSFTRTLPCHHRLVARTTYSRATPLLHDVPVKGVVAWYLGYFPLLVFRRLVLHQQESSLSSGGWSFFASRAVVAAAHASSSPHGSRLPY